jgi:hypothetical protein
MENFYHILQRLPITVETSSLNNQFGGTSPFKVQVNFYIPIFEGKVNANSLEKWLNLLEVYFYVHNFFESENITLHSLRLYPMSNIGGKRTRSKVPQRILKYMGSSPLGIFLWMWSRINITLLVTMLNSKSHGPHCVKRGTKQCQISPIPSIHCETGWVSKILSDISF